MTVFIFHLFLILKRIYFLLFYLVVAICGFLCYAVTPHSSASQNKVVCIICQVESLQIAGESKFMSQKSSRFLRKAFRNMQIFPHLLLLTYIFIFVYMIHANPVEIIKKKRDGGVLTKEEILHFISAYLEGKIEEYQTSALLMAIYFRGLNEEETMAFVEAFIDSGERVDLSFINKPKVDKHSTGGVGDKTSIILAPLIACFDVVVPMMSGRGLGHTGGTLDKLESIPGFNVHLSVKEFKEILSKINVCMIGQTDSLVPADKKIYALRDVTATVENTGLITASITSKKIAEGTEGIVYDVKCGIGSTLHNIEHSRTLADNLLKVTKAFGRKAMALLTDMNEPLGYAIGNWVEVEECISIMNPNGRKSALSNDLIEVMLNLAGAMLLLAGKCKNIEEGIRMSKKKLESGECFNKFVQLVEIQGGGSSLIEAPMPKVTEEIKANATGYIAHIDALKFGLASVNLGCGRKKLSDKIDYSAGIKLMKKTGDEVKKNDVLYLLLGESNDKISSAKKILESAVEISNKPSKSTSRIIEIID
jgi:pyrimidine-nucleoside phosphorylase